MSQIAVLFPGQGAQEVGMGRDLIGKDHCLDSLLEQGSAATGVDLARLALRGPARDLASTRTLQPLLTALNLALFRKLESAEVKPLAFAGHSLGELSALAAAGFCSDETAVSLAAVRAQLMDEQASRRAGAMIAVSPMDCAQACAVCRDRPGEVLGVAAVNGPTQVTISGDTQAIDSLAAELRTQPQLQVTALRVSGAWHSEHMRDAALPLHEALAQAELRQANAPMVFNRDGISRTDATEIPALLAGQLTSPVRFDLVVAELMRQGITDYIEVGPGKVLRGLVRLSCLDPAVRIHNVTDLRSVERCAAEMHGSHR